MLGFLKSVWDALCAIGRFIAETVREFFDWLRKPGSKLKLFCAVLAFFLAVAALRAYSAEQQIVTITQACEVEKGKLNATIANDKLTLAQRDAALADIAKNLKAEADKLRALKAQNAALAAELEAKRAQAALSEAAYLREFHNRPATCTAALNAMEAACSTLRDY